MYRACFVLGLTALSFPPVGSGQTCEEAYVEKIDVKSRTNIRVSTVASYLDVAVGDCISTEELDSALIQAQARLRLIGIYKSVNFSLKKGSQRDWYVIEADLVPRSLYYAGGLTRLSWAESDYFSPASFQNDAREQKYGAFVGTRGLFGSNLRADVEFHHSRIQSRGEYEYSHTYDNKTYNNSTKTRGKNAENDLFVNLFHPSLFGSSFVGGATYIRRLEKAEDETTHRSIEIDESENISVGEKSTDTSTDKYIYQTFMGKVGYRFRQLTLLAYASRQMHKFDGTYGGGDAEFETSYGPILTITNKTNLALMEPGYYSKISYNIDGAPKETDERTWTLDAEYSYLPAASYSITPRGQVFWSDTDGNLFRLYTYGLKQQYAASRSFIIELETSAVSWVGAFESFQRVAALNLIYVQPTFNYEFSFLFGQRFDYFETDRRRVGE